MKAAGYQRWLAQQKYDSGTIIGYNERGHFD
jgi:hypothetical protein